jgi:hypothetical protein
MEIGIKVGAENANAGSRAAAGSGEGLKLWRAEVSECSIRLVNCPKGRWPASDEQGFTVYDNTHFDTPSQAWDKVEREYAASTEITIRDINQAEKHLGELKDRLVTDSLRALKAKENRQAWNRQNDRTEARGTEHVR